MDHNLIHFLAGIVAGIIIGLMCVPFIMKEANPMNHCVAIISANHTEQVNAMVFGPDSFSHGWHLNSDGTYCIER